MSVLALCTVLSYLQMFYNSRLLCVHGVQPFEILASMFVQCLNAIPPIAWTPAFSLPCHRLFEFVIDFFANKYVSFAHFPSPTPGNQYSSGSRAYRSPSEL